MTPTGHTYSLAFFEGQAERSLASARVVLDLVFPLLRPKRVVDVGCGVGTWMRAAIDLGADPVVGIDGDYVDRAALLVDPSRFIAGNMAARSLRDILGSDADTPFDLVVCMEVAEHLPHARAASLVAELAALGDAVLFSAAVPFQYGTSHVNEQWPEFWAILFREQGFSCYDCLRHGIWADPRVEWWYAQNAFIFARDGSDAARALPPQTRSNGGGLARVHPENLLANLLGLPRRYRTLAATEEMADLRALVAADRQQARAVPPLAAVTRASAADASARDVFPWTRSETYHPEQEIADGQRQLAETGHWLERANVAFQAERAARDAAEAALTAETAARLLAEERARRVEDAVTQMRLHAAARLQAEFALSEHKAADADRSRALVTERATIQAEREAAVAEADMRTRALDGYAAELETRALWLNARAAELGDQAGRVEARAVALEDASRAIELRASRKARRIVRRLRSFGAEPPAPPASEAPLPAPTPATTEPEAAASPQPLLPDAAEPDGPPECDEIAPPGETGTDLDPPHIRCFGRYVGEVSRPTLDRAVSRLARLDVFDAADYLRRNADVAGAGVNPQAHFLQSGALEGRGRVNPEDLARLMSGLTLHAHVAKALPQADDASSDLPSLVAQTGHIGLFASSHGNVFMEDVAQDLAADLRSVGVRVDVLDETFEVDARPPLCVFIAPHEFFTLGRGSEWVRDDVLANAFMFGTEQVQTTWFNFALPFVMMSAGVLDICAQTADLFERTGMPALHILPGARLRPHPLTDQDRRHPLFGVLPRAALGDIDPSAPFAARPLDIAFFGTSSPRRDQFFARNAAFFAAYEAFNYCRRPHLGPIRGDGEDGALTRLAGHVAGHSKIMLNIHREEFGYFEWHRMVRLGMCSGSLVVSDPCLPHPSFVANEHYLQENLRHIPELLHWLLDTEDGAAEAERVRANADRLITGLFETRRTAAQMLRFFARHRPGSH